MPVYEQVSIIKLYMFSEGGFPGCQILVARNGNIVFNRSYGKTGLRDGRPVDARTVYDAGLNFRVLYGLIMNAPTSLPL